MASEVWWRNPRLYMRELVEVGVGNIIWDKGSLLKHRTNALDYVEAHYGHSLPFRMMILSENSCAEYTLEGGPDKPIAVYPVFHYGQDADWLMELIEQPVGEDSDLCYDLKTPVDERPVFGQEHRVVIASIPDGRSIQARKFQAYLRDVQLDHPEVIIHYHGAYRWKQAFGAGFRSADVQPREWAAKGQLALPGGNVIDWEKSQAHAKWITMFGFTPGDMSSPRNRCMYNIKAGEWAGKHFTEEFSFRTTATKNPDVTTPEVDYVAPTSSRIIPIHAVPQADDKILCSMCSLQNSCKYFRDGAVCSLPDAEPTSLAKFFKTRDSASIVDGLGTLLAFNARRLERGARIEEALDEVDPDVTKLANAVFEQGVKLAKLIDPALRGAGVKVNILNAGVGSTGAVAASTPQEMTGAIVRALEQKGIRREDITPEMISGVLEGMANPETATKAISGEVLDG